MRKEIDIYENFHETVKRLSNNGIFLLTGEEGNPMTIGWGTIGRVWGKPIFTVLVRPSRYSYGLLEKTGEFSVNIPGDELSDKLEYCGEHSGRDVDKVKRCKFTLKPGIKIKTPYIAECHVHYECRVVHKNKVIPDNMENSIIERYYPSDDYHTVYFGEILGVYRET